MTKELPEGQQRILDTVHDNPDITATQVHHKTGLSEMYVRRVLNMLVDQKRIHVSGFDELYQRRKPKLYSIGPAKTNIPTYPYVPLEEQKENIRRYDRDWQRRRSIKKMIAQAGVFGSMVAQLGKRNTDE